MYASPLFRGMVALALAQSDVSRSALVLWRELYDMVIRIDASLSHFLLSWK